MSANSIPLTTFRGYLRCHRPIVLTDIGRQVMTDFFPYFANPSVDDLLHQLETSERDGLATKENRDLLSKMKQLVGAGVKVESRRHRRYAGGDGLLPRSRYFSVCRDNTGDDGGTMCREIFEYRRKDAPGLIFVGDSSDKKIFYRLGVDVAFETGYSGFCVLAVPPNDLREQEVWKAQYKASLEKIHGRVVPVPFVIVIETEQKFSEIDGVLDLRLPAAQEWLHATFRATGGTPWYSKVTPTSPRFFVGMLPSLMEHEYGGCELTHGIGSWLRANHVSGLIFPSARSNAATLAVENKVVDYHGWNFVDYRDSPNVQEAVVDASLWKEFTPPVSLKVGRGFDSSLMEWFVQGIEDEYQSIRSQILSEDVDSNGQEAESVNSESPAIARITSLAMRGFERGGRRWLMRKKQAGDSITFDTVCIICGYEDLWYPPDADPPFECPQCHTS